MKKHHNLPLSGVTVLDLSRVLAGPWASQMLADLGARVIKVERPGSGDDTRGWGPPFAQNEDGENVDAAYFMAANRNKQSLAIDIASPKGAQLIRKLATKADILVENFKPGGLGKYGLDFEALHAINSRLVYCSITGFGQTGPYRDRPGYDYMIQAMGGMMSVTGPPDEPMKAGLATADLFTGMYAASATLAALRHAERTGEGQHLDIALFDCQLAILSNQAASYLIGGEAPRRAGNAHQSIVPYQLFETANGRMVVAVGNDDQFNRFCSVIDAPELARDARFGKNRDRVVNREALIPIISGKLKQRPAVHWLDAFEKANIPAGPVNDIAAAFADPQAAARNILATAQRDGEPPYQYAVHPVKYSATPVAPTAPPPKLGADSDAVLREMLDLDQAGIAALRRKGVIG